MAATTFSLLFNGGTAAAPILFLLTLNFFLWIRVALSSDRSLTFLVSASAFGWACCSPWW
ncbi:MAG: hypothetical protein HC880_17035 [Bacteroidia bacterium]|nr:hypothetical protein [Bacteroidia bacterium]